MLQCHWPSGRVAEGLPFHPTTDLARATEKLASSPGCLPGGGQECTVYSTQALGTAAFHLFVSSSSWGLHDRLYSKALV